MEEKFVLTKEYSLKFDQLCKETYASVAQVDSNVLCKKYVYDEEFDTMRKNRIEISFYKYGPVRKNYGPTGNINAIGTFIKCIQKYEKTHNTEFLLDAVNYLMFEYMWPKVHKHTCYVPFDKYKITVCSYYKEAIACVEQYKAHFNKAYLCLASVYLQLESKQPTFTDAYFKATDSKESAGIDGFSVKELEIYE